MDRDEMFYSVNKGVPNYLTVPINVDTIIDYLERLRYIDEKKISSAKKKK